MSTQSRHPFLGFGEAPKIFAHRGNLTKKLINEGVADNTRATFEAAVDAGITFVECDSHLTKDGVVVLFHDYNLRRVTGDPRRVSAVTYAELTQLMADRGGLLTLQEALDDFGALKLNVDVKDKLAAVPIGKLIRGKEERVLITSFSDKRRKTTLANTPGTPATSPGSAEIVKLILALNSGAHRTAKQIISRIDALQLPVKQSGLPVITPKLIDFAHLHAKEVHAWTINDPEQMRKLFAMGVDGIVTDEADMALEIAATVR